jgi:hypothetical protein
MILIQSVRKKISSAMAVATCRATMKARYGLCPLFCVDDCVTNVLQLPPMRAGMSTE